MAKTQRDIVVLKIKLDKFDQENLSLMVIGGIENSRSRLKIQNLHNETEV
jgi:hypothetical protein